MTTAAELVALQETLYRSGNPTRRWLHCIRRDWIFAALRRQGWTGLLTRQTAEFFVALAQLLIQIHGQFGFTRREDNHAAPHFFAVMRLIGIQDVLLGDLYVVATQFRQGKPGSDRILA